MGWDDNGLNVERRVQILTGTRVDPSLPYDPDFRPAGRSGQAEDRPIAVSRPNFQELCGQVVEQLEQAYFEPVVQRRPVCRLVAHLPHRWPRATHASQLGLLRLLRRDLAYRAESPTLWDVDFQTAVAQAEMQDRGSRRLQDRFAGPAGGRCGSTPRGPSCCRPASPSLRTPTTTATSRCSVPGHHAAVPRRGADRGGLADPRRPGLAMICTFGDTTDVTWWRAPAGPAHRRPARRPPAPRRLGRGWVGVGRPPDGAAPTTSSQARPSSRRRPASWRCWPRRAHRRRAPADHPSREVLGERHPAARDRHVAPVVHPLPDTDVLLARGKELAWWPDFMRVRYENWVNGLQGDWNITRQRFFGVRSRPGIRSTTRETSTT